MNLNYHGDKCKQLNVQIGNVTDWYWPTSDTSTFNLIISDWIQHIRPFLQKNFTPDGDSTVIQAGGNCGVYPLLFTEFFGHVYTFEPDPLSFYCLVNNCQFQQITPMNCAVGEGPDSVLVHELTPVNRGMNRVVPTEKPAVPVVAIDSFGFKNVKLMQLDLEGYEPKALLGAKRTIEFYKPILILECADNFDDVFKVIEPLGYVADEQLTRLDRVFLHKDKK